MNLKKILDEHKQYLKDKTKGKRADLTGADLRNADLTGADLRRADLTGADLRNADLRNADLTGADLRNADLTGADLRNAELTGADLRRANLTGADLTRADLTGADLTRADLRNADLGNAKGILQWQAPQGEKRINYSVKHDDCVMHQIGCFWGDTDEAVRAIREKYGENSLYEKFLLMQNEALLNE